MDAILLLILFLIKNPDIESVEGLIAKLQKELGSECPYSSINDLNHDLDVLTKAGILDKNGKPTLDALKIVYQDKILKFIQENLPSPEEYVGLFILMILSKDHGIALDEIQARVDEEFGKNVRTHPVSHYLLNTPDRIRKENFLYFLV